MTASFDSVTPYNGSPFISASSSSLSATCPSYHSLTSKLSSDPMPSVTFPPQTPTPFSYAAVAAAAAASGYCAVPQNSDHLSTGLDSGVTFKNFYGEDPHSRNPFEVGLSNSGSFRPNYEGSASCVSDKALMDSYNFSSSISQTEADPRSFCKDVLSFPPMLEESPASPTESSSALPMICSGEESKISVVDEGEEEGSSSSIELNNGSPSKENENKNLNINSFQNENVEGSDENSATNLETSGDSTALQSAQSTTDNLAEIVKKSMIETVSA